MSKFTPSPGEVALVNQIFNQTDTQKLGVITGEAAVKIFNGAKLPPSVLAEIWNIADDENNGVLTRKGVAVAVRLLGHAQRGEKVSEALVNKRESTRSLRSVCSFGTSDASTHSGPDSNYRGTYTTAHSTDNRNSNGQVSPARVASTHAARQGKVHEAVHQQRSGEWYFERYVLSLSI